MQEIANRLLDPRGLSARSSQAERVGRKALQRSLHRRTPLEQVLAACSPATAQWARAVFADPPWVAFVAVTEGGAASKRHVVSVLCAYGVEEPQGAQGPASVAPGNPISVLRRGSPNYFHLIVATAMTAVLSSLRIAGSPLCSAANPASE